VLDYLTGFELQRLHADFLTAGFILLTDLPNTELTATSAFLPLRRQMKLPEWRRLLRALTAQCHLLPSTVATGAVTARRTCVHLDNNQRPVAVGPVAATARLLSAPVVEPAEWCEPVIRKGGRVIIE
jgi:hypothetical protein